MPVAPVDAPINAVGARQCSVVMNVAIHLCWLVQVAGRVILYSRETDRVRRLWRDRQIRTEVETSLKV